VKTTQLEVNISSELCNENQATQINH